MKKIYSIDFKTNTVTTYHPRTGEPMVKSYKTAAAAKAAATRYQNTLVWIEYFQTQANGLFPTKQAARLYQLPGEKIEYVESNWTDSLYRLIKGEF